MKWMVALVAMLAAFPAHAFTVVNLSGSTRVLVVEQYGRQWEVVIEPGKTYRYYSGKADIGLPGRSMILNAESYDRYAIWPDDTLAIQKRHINRGRSR